MIPYLRKQVSLEYVNQGNANEEEKTECQHLNRRNVLLLLQAYHVFQVCFFQEEKDRLR